MSQLLYNYQCKHCGCHFTGWNKLSERFHHECKQCGEQAGLFINGCHFKLDPVSGDFPTTTKRWADAHEKANLDDLKRKGLRKTESRFFI